MLPKTTKYLSMLRRPKSVYHVSGYDIKKKKKEKRKEKKYAVINQ